MPKENRFNLGKNKRKEQDTHADYRGQINVDGVEFWLDAWINTNGETGEKFFSGTVKPKQERPPQTPEPDPGDVPF